MKRFVLVLFALSTLAFVGACKKEKKAGDEAAKPADTAGTTDTTAPTPADQAVPPAPAPGTDTAANPGQPAMAPAAADSAAIEATGIAECDAYVKKLMACEKYPQQAKDTLKKSADAWKQAATAGGNSAKEAATQCKKMDEAAAASLKQLGC